MYCKKEHKYMFYFTFLCIALKELDTELKRCKDEFKEFERQDVKHREDLKHVKTKIKKTEEKVEKVRYICLLHMWH